MGVFFIIKLFPSFGGVLASARGWSSPLEGFSLQRGGGQLLWRGSRFSEGAVFSRGGVLAPRAEVLTFGTVHALARQWSKNNHQKYLSLTL
jgi:hypothetical protein